MGNTTKLLDTLYWNLGKPELKKNNLSRLTLQFKLQIYPNPCVGPEILHITSFFENIFHKKFAWCFINNHSEYKSLPMYSDAPQGTDA